MSKEKILTIDDLPMHKDTYFFGYGIDIDKPYDMANQIIKLRQENKELSHIVANKVISDYDIDTPLKTELGEVRLKIVSLEDALHCYKQENEELKKQLHEASIEIQHLIEQDIDCPSNCNKLEELKERLEASRRVSKHHLNRELDLENKQKEFIEWLEDSVRTLEMLDKTFTLKNYKNKIRIYKEILSKYKEIIGGKYE